MERLRIEYGTGYMELNVEAFFPCKMPAMRKAARLINSYCTDEARAELLSELRELADGYKALCDMYTEKAEGPLRIPRSGGTGGRNSTKRKSSANGWKIISG